MSKKPDRYEILSRIERLPIRLQRQVLEYAASLQPCGTAGKDLLRFQSAITSEDLDAMTSAIEEGCEKNEETAW